MLISALPVASCPWTTLLGSPKVTLFPDTIVIAIKKIIIPENATTTHTPRGFLVPKLLC